MSTRDSPPLGVLGVLSRAVNEFFAYTILAWLATFIYTLLAFVFALVATPSVVGYLWMAVTVVAIHLAGVWAEDTDVETLDLDFEDATLFQRTFVLMLLYLVVAIPLSTLVLWSALWASYVGFQLGFPTGGVVVAVGYPLVDLYLAEKLEVSVLRGAGFGTLKLVGAIVHIYSISNSFMEEAERQTTALY